MAWALARIVLFAGAAAMVACAAVTGLGDYTIQPEEAPESGTSSDGGGALPDVVVPPSDDAATDATIACPAPAMSNGTIHAVHLTSALTVDGVGGEWPCGARIVLDGTTAQAKIFAPPQAAAELAVAWTEDRLFFLVRVTGATSLATASTSAVDIYRNDAVELYLGVDNPHPGPYEPTDLQIIIDYLNHANLYRNGQPVEGGLEASHVVTGAAVTGNDYVVEMSIAAGGPRPTFAAGQKFGFDLQIDEHAPPDASDNRSVFWLFQNPNPYGATGGCTPPRDAPACDQAVWGALVLDP